MTTYSDIVIAGGGMVGVSLALQLGAVLPSQVSIRLVESFAVPAAVQESSFEYHPSFDARSTALSYSSRVIYEQMGVWEQLQQRACPIDSIHVSTRGRFGSTVLHAQEHGWDSLGYVVENAWLGNALIQALHQQGRVEICSPASVSAATPMEEGLRLQLTGTDEAEIETALLLVADGAASKLREQLGVAVVEKPYGQHALVANVAFSESHGNCAYERFTDEGPLALLPLLTGHAGENRSALVWTLPPERAQSLLAAGEEELVAALQDRFGYRLGRITQVGERSSYPLSLVQSSEQVRRGVVVMGNAAHALHPVAGQGFNLALRDVAELGRVLADGLAKGRSPGDLAVLEKYQRSQQADQEKTITFSDQVPALFMHADPAIGLGRDLALAGLDVLPALKREFVRHAAGMAGTGIPSHG